MLHLPVKGLATIQAELKPDGHLGLRWEASDQKSWATATLSRRDGVDGQVAAGR